MILLIDNYDSFSYNLVQMIGSINQDIQVVRNDKITIREIEDLAPSHLVLSPGPGYPGGCGHYGRCDQAAEGQGTHPGSMPGTSGHMRGIWRNHLPCKKADAWKTEQDRVRQQIAFV